MKKIYFLLLVLFLTACASRYSFEGGFESLSKADDDSSPGLELNSSEDAVDNIISIINSSGVEVWNTNLANGSFNTRFIYLPDDADVSLGEVLTLKYNRIEFFNIDNNDGSFSNNTINLSNLRFPIFLIRLKATESLGL